MGRKRSFERIQANFLKKASLDSNFSIFREINSEKPNFKEHTNIDMQFKKSNTNINLNIQYKYNYKIQEKEFFLKK